MFGKETFHKISFVFLCLFFLLSPFSISLSQIFCGLSLLFLFLEGIQKKTLPKPPTSFWFWIGLYLSFLITPILHPESFQWQKNVVKSEFGDVWMGFLLLHQTNLSPLEKKQLKRYVYMGGVFLILSGLVSLFSHYRLAPYVMDGFRYLEGKRLPHLLSQIQGISIYLPIGFQSTHLTYGGLLAVYLPSVWEKTYRFLRSEIMRTRYWKWALSSVFLSGLSLVFLFLNQSRSIWIGFLLGAVILFQKQKTSLRKLFPWLLGGTFFLLTIFVLFYQTNWLFQRAIEDLFAKRSLENQRIWIHKMNFAILKEDFGLGIGAGMYSERFLDFAIPIVDALPELYYDLFITPKSHAHFDFLHGVLLGGILACFFSLGFLWTVTRSLEQTNRHLFFFLGVFVVLIAGSFQCFLLDDEVLLPFLGLLALLPNQNTETQSRFSQKQTIRFREIFAASLFRSLPFSFVFLLLWISLSLTVTYLWSRTEDKDLVLHRTRTKDNFPSPLSQLSINGEKTLPLPEGTKDWYFKLAGCLDKEANFRRDSRRREKPIQLQILRETDKTIHQPKTITVEIRKRESFDQDKEYRVQGETVWKTIPFSNVEETIRISVDPKEFTNDAAEFVDFGILYEWEGNSPHLPRIQISGNCE